MAPEARTRVHDVERFSRVALASFLALLATGAYATWVELDHASIELLHSQYGRTVLAKLALFVGTLPLAVLNKTVLVPGLRERPGDAASLLRQYVARELGLLVVVVGLTAWLVQTAPPS
jgi:putative copper export protein